MYKKIVSLFLVALLTSSTASIAFASGITPETTGGVVSESRVETKNNSLSRYFIEAYSTIATFWFQGLLIKGQTSLTSIPGSLEVITWVWNDSGNVRAYSIGAESFLFNNQGYAIAQSGVFFNDVPTSGIGVFVFQDTKWYSGQAVYARGTGYVYNYDRWAWESFYIGITPTLIARTANDNTQTQMNQFMLDFERAYDNNGMVEVVGINGVKGFAYAKEIRGTMPSSPENAKLMQSRRLSRGAMNRYANVYDKDGSIVDSFPIVYGEVRNIPR